MTFNNFNEPWIKCLTACKKFILKEGAVQKMTDFLHFHGAHFPVLPIPLIIEKNHYDELFYVSKLLIRVQTKIIRFLVSSYSHKEILEMFNLPYAIEPFIDWDRLKNSNKVIGRFDIVPSSNGYQFCEINADPAVNGLKLFDSFFEYCKSLGWSFINNQSSPRKDITEYLRKVVLEHKFKRIIIFSLEFYINEGSGTVKSLFNIIKESIPEVQVLLVDENSYPKDILTPENGKKTLIYRMAIYRDIKNDKLLTDIFNSGATMINTFETEIRSNKIWFAIFHDSKYQKLLSKEERSTISKFIPPTFYLTSKNLKKFLDNKEHYVFKKNMSYGGLGILMGAEHKKEFLVKTLIDLNSWTAQKIINTPDILLPESNSFLIKPHKIVLGLFFVNNKHSGMLVRASSKSSVVNVTYGGAKMGWAYPIFENEREYCVKQLYLHSKKD